jgi:hypothetical protein
MRVRSAKALELNYKDYGHKVEEYGLGMFAYEVCSIMRVI